MKTEKVNKTEGTAARRTRLRKLSIFARLRKLSIFARLKRWLYYVLGYNIKLEEKLKQKFSIYDYSVMAKNYRYYLRKFKKLNLQFTDSFLPADIHSMEIAELWFDQHIGKIDIVDINKSYWLSCVYIEKHNDFKFGLISENDSVSNFALEKIIEKKIPFSSYSIKYEECKNRSVKEYWLWNNVDKLHVGLLDDTLYRKQLPNYFCEFVKLPLIQHFSLNLLAHNLPFPNLNTVDQKIHIFEDSGSRENDLEYNQDNVVFSNVLLELRSKNTEMYNLCTQIVFKNFIKTIF